MLRIFALAVGFSATLTGAVAACAQDTETVLDCSVRNGSKQLQVCIDGKDINYSFGIPGRAPELSLRAQVAFVDHRPWNGVGRSIWESTTFRNGNWAYEVHISVDRLEDDHPTYGGVTVYEDDEPRVTLDCDDGTASIGLWAVMDAKEANGVCWKVDNQAWGKCPK